MAGYTAAVDRLTTALGRMPGIGAKSAERLVLELRDKVGAVRGDGATPAGSTSTGTGGREPWRGQVTEALVGLGWSAKQATDAVTSVSASADPDSSVAALLRMALRELGR